jgi:hypothetical protein
VRTGCHSERSEESLFLTPHHFGPTSSPAPCRAVKRRAGAGMRRAAARPSSKIVIPNRAAHRADQGEGSAFAPRAPKNPSCAQLCAVILSAAKNPSSSRPATSTQHRLACHALAQRAQAARPSSKIVIPNRAAHRADQGEGSAFAPRAPKNPSCTQLCAVILSAAKNLSSSRPTTSAQHRLPGPRGSSMSEGGRRSSQAVIPSAPPSHAFCRSASASCDLR